MPVHYQSYDFFHKLRKASLNLHIMYRFIKRHQYRFYHDKRHDDGWGFGVLTFLKANSRSKFLLYEVRTYSRKYTFYALTANLLHAIYACRLLNKIPNVLSCIYYCQCI